MGYDLNEKTYSKELNLKELKPYGDTLNDGKVQLSFTLPVENNEKGEEAAKILAKKWESQILWSQKALHLIQHSQCIFYMDQLHIL